MTFNFFLFIYSVLLSLICIYIPGVCNFLHLVLLAVSFVVIHFLFSQLFSQFNMKMCYLLKQKKKITLIRLDSFQLLLTVYTFLKNQQRYLTRSTLPLRELESSDKNAIASQQRFSRMNGQWIKEIAADCHMGTYRRIGFVHAENNTWLL